MQTCYILSGLPGSGKTFWSKNYIRKHPKTLVVSRDDLRYAFHCGRYVFDTTIEPIICDITDSIIESFLELKRDFIIDETNGIRFRRYQLISMIHNYNVFNKRKIKIIAVEFPMKDNLKNRMKDSRGYTKKQWADIIDRMKNLWEKINKEEGFDKVINANNSNIRK
jgi:predicted kinase